MPLYKFFSIISDACRSLSAGISPPAERADGQAGYFRGKISQRLVQAYKSFRLCARSELRLAWFILLIFTLLCLVVLPLVGFFREDVQFACFPIILLCLLGLPRQPALRVPAPLAVIAALLWLGSALHLSGVTPAEDNYREVLFARFESDSQGLRGRGLFQRYEQIARTYELVGGRLLHHGVGDAEQAARWLAEHHPDSPFVVTGHPQWLEVVFNQETKFAEQKADGWFEGEVSWNGERFSVGYLPRVLHVPGEPRDLSLHFLAWLAESLRSSFDSNFTSQFLETASAERALQRDALQQITELSGNWLSDGPYALANHLLATFDLIEALQQPGESKQLLDASLHSFRTAAAQVQLKNDPELYALIFNNAAVAGLAAARNPQEIFQARRWFWTALDVARDGANVPLGSRLALQNLSAFDRVVRVKANPQ